MRSQTGVYDPDIKKLTFTISPTVVLDEDTYPLAIKAFQTKAVTPSEVWQYFIHQLLLGNDDVLMVIKSCSDKKFEEASAAVEEGITTSIVDSISANGLTPDAVYEILERDTPLKK